MVPNLGLHTCSSPTGPALGRKLICILTGRLVLLMALAFIAVTTGCNGAATPQSRPHAGAGGDSLLPNVLVGAQGAVAVRHQGGSMFIPIGFGARLLADDLLNISGGSAAVFCGHESQWDASPTTLQSGTNRSIPCLHGQTATPAPDIARLRTRGEPHDRPDNLPYVLTPRTGFVLSDRPTLRWHMVSSTTTVTITLESTDGLARTAKVVSGTELAYPDDWPPLQRNGADYRLLVQPTTGMSAAVSSPGSGFTALDSESAARVQALAERLKARVTNDAAQALLLAELYLHHDERYPLRSEAVELLRNVPAGEKIRAIQQLLGEVYLQMGLFAEAQQAFEHALVLATAAGETEFEADALLYLGVAACLRGNQVQAVSWWQTAQARYTELELSTKAEQAAARLKMVAVDCK